MADPDNDPNAGPDDLEDDAQSPPAPLPLPHVGDPSTLRHSRNVSPSRQTLPDLLDPRSPSEQVPAKPPTTGPAGPTPQGLP